MILMLTYFPIFMNDFDIVLSIEMMISLLILLHQY